MYSWLQFREKVFLPDLLGPDPEGIDGVSLQEKEEEKSEQTDHFSGTAKSKSEGPQKISLCEELSVTSPSMLTGFEEEVNYRPPSSPSVTIRVTHCPICHRSFRVIVSCNTCADRHKRCHCAWCC